MNCNIISCEYVRFLPLTLISSGRALQESQLFGKGMGGIKLDGCAAYIRFPARPNIDNSKSQNKKLKLRTFNLNVFRLTFAAIEIYNAAKPYAKRDNSIECHQTHRNRPLWRFTGFAILKQSQLFSRGLKRINYAYKTLWREFFGDFLYV